MKSRRGKGEGGVGARRRKSGKEEDGQEEEEKGVDPPGYLSSHTLETIPN